MGGGGWWVAGGGGGGVGVEVGGVVLLGAVLRQGVDGVDGRGGLGALVALRLVLGVLLDGVLADEGAVLVELPVAALAVVHQAVVTLLGRAVQRRLAALQRLVVLVATGNGRERHAREKKHKVNVRASARVVCVCVCVALTLTLDPSCRLGFTGMMK